MRIILFVLLTTFSSCGEKEHEFKDSIQNRYWTIASFIENSVDVTQQKTIAFHGRPFDFSTYSHQGFIDWNDKHIGTWTMPADKPEIYLAMDAGLPILQQNYSNDTLLQNSLYQLQGLYTIINIDWNELRIEKKDLTSKIAFSTN